MHMIFLLLTHKKSCPNSLKDCIQLPPPSSEKWNMEDVCNGAATVPSNDHSAAQILYGTGKSAFPTTPGDYSIHA